MKKYDIMCVVATDVDSCNTLLSLYGKSGYKLVFVVNTGVPPCCNYNLFLQKEIEE